VTVVTPQLTVGRELPPLTVRVTRADLVRYAGASGDFNPIHWSDRAARAVGMPGVIAHGMLTMALAMRVVTDWVGDPARIRDCFCRFTHPLPVPDDDNGTELRLGGKVTAVSESTATLTLTAVVTGPDGRDVKVLGHATAEVERD